MLRYRFHWQPSVTKIRNEINPVTSSSDLGRILLVPSLFSRLSSVLVGFKILFFWHCLPKTVGLEGLPNLLLHELEDLANFERILVLMCFFVTTWLESLVFKLEPTNPSEIGRLVLLRMENFACEVYWFQNSAVVY